MYPCNHVGPHSALGYRPPAPEAIWPGPSVATVNRTKPGQSSWNQGLVNTVTVGKGWLPGELVTGVGEAGAQARQPSRAWTFAGRARGDPGPSRAWNLPRRVNASRGISASAALHSVTMDRAAQEAWMAQWRSAAIALAEQRARELGDLRDAEALAASDALLSLALVVPIDPARLTGSGLVHQQELFHRRAVA